MRSSLTVIAHLKCLQHSLHGCLSRGFDLAKRLLNTLCFKVSVGIKFTDFAIFLLPLTLKLQATFRRCITIYSSPPDVNPITHGGLVSQVQIVAREDQEWLGLSIKMVSGLRRRPVNKTAAKSTVQTAGLNEWHYLLWCLRLDFLVWITWMTTAMYEPVHAGLAAFPQSGHSLPKWPPGVRETVEALTRCPTTAITGTGGQSGHTPLLTLLIYDCTLGHCTLKRSIAVPRFFWELPRF